MGVAGYVTIGLMHWVMFHYFFEREEKNDPSFSLNVLAPFMLSEMLAQTLVFLIMGRIPSEGMAVDWLVNYLSIMVGGGIGYVLCDRALP